jgi:hypothetical protein
MKRRSKALGLISILGVALFFAAATVWSAATTAQAQTPVMKIVPADQTVDISNGNFSVDVVIEGVSDLGSFEFELIIDPEVVRLVGVTAGPFLGSTGRQLRCPAPTYSQPAAGMPADTLKFACATGTGIQGAAGSGTLATVTLAPRKAGTSILNLIAWQGDTGISDTMGAPIDVTSSGGQVTVVGSGPEPTPEPDEPTAIPTSQPPPPPITPTPRGISWLTPEPGQTPMSRLIDPDIRAGSASGGSGSQGSASGGAQGTTGGSPRAGEGPPQNPDAVWPAITAAILAAGGMALLSLAFYTRRAYSRRRIEDEL